MGKVIDYSKGDKISVNDGWLPREKVQRLLTTEAITTQGRIGQNVQQGQDMTGGSLRGYKQSYIDAIEAGQVRKPGGPRKVSTKTNLTISGDLLGSMQIFPYTKGKAFGAIINFVGGHWSGMRTKALAQLLEKKGFTKWFGFAKQDIDRIDKNYDLLVQKHLEDLVEP